MNGILHHFGFGNQLGLRLVIASLIIGSVLSVFSTGLQLAASYTRQSSEATDVLDRVDATFTTSLERAVWTFNFEQVNIILDGLYADPNIISLKLDSVTGQSWTRGPAVEGDATTDVARTYTLIHQFEDGRQHSIGTLDVQLSLSSVRERIWAQFWITLLSNLAKAYLAAAALLYLVNRMISRHLQRIAEHVDTASGSPDGRLQLDRPQPPKPDDLDRIVNAVLRYENRTRDQVTSLNNEIAERKQAQTDAQNALSIRSRFLATMSHEIRTPLNAIMGFLHLIANFKGIEDKPKIYAETANRASHQLLSLINNTLDMSRIEAKAVEITLSETDIHSLAQDWHQTAEAIRHARGKDLDIRLDIDPYLPPMLLMDARHVTQIVSNLLDNAIKFTDAGHVDISVKSTTCDSGLGLDITISDTGNGIPEDARAQIFERFTQADNSMLRVHGGTGLGLAICRELARLMGASLTLEDRMGDGFGTVFLLKLKNVAVVDLAI